MIESGICTALVRGGEGAWRASSTPGISIKVLRADKETGRSSGFLVNYMPPVSLSQHHFRDSSLDS